MTARWTSWAERLKTQRACCTRVALPRESAMKAAARPLCQHGLVCRHTVYQINSCTVDGTTSHCQLGAHRAMTSALVRMLTVTTCQALRRRRRHLRKAAAWQARRHGLAEMRREPWHSHNGQILQSRPTLSRSRWARSRVSARVRNLNSPNGPLHPVLQLHLPRNAINAFARAALTIRLQRLH